MSRTIKCIIVDDEEYAADVLNNYIDKSEDLQLLTRCANVFELMDKMESENADLIFMDIQMPQIDGMQAIKLLGDAAPKVILTTAFQEYAVEAFELNVVDYLMKPFSYDRFCKAVDKVRVLLSKSDTVKYARSGLGDSESVELFQNIKSHLEKNKSYLNSVLRLDDLAKEMQVNRNHLSQAVNTQTQQTFWSFINKFRVEEAKNRLIDSKYGHLTIEAIALESGFNSISGFNTIFKKLTGSTPSEYRVIELEKRKAD